MDARKMLDLAEEYEGYPLELAKNIEAEQREQDALIAESMGHPEIAQAIRTSSH